MNKTFAHIFPAFVSDYCGDEVSVISQYNQHFNQYLETASSESGIDISSFDILHNKFINEELRSQLLAYVFSCSISDILHDNNIKPSLIAGYSMGIYATLYHAGVYPFETGIKLIQKAYNIIFSHKGNIEYSMATIAGIDEDDLQSIIYRMNSDSEIINTNSLHSYVISGKQHEVEKIVQEASSEGAMLARKLPVTVPYHSRHMKKASIEFEQYVKIQDFKDNVFPIVSLIDQRIIESADEVRKELILNISNKINWYQTMLKMIKFDARIMLECGAGKSLYKMSKFIDEDFKVYPLSKISNYMEKVKQF